MTATLCSGALVLLVALGVTCVFGGALLGVKNGSEIGCLHSAELMLELKLL